MLPTPTHDVETLLGARKYVHDAHAQRDAAPAAVVRHAHLLTALEYSEFFSEMLDFDEVLICDFN